MTPVAPPEFVVDFPTMWVASDWVERHCVVPDGFEKGEAFTLVNWQAWALLNFYRVRPDAQVGQLAPAFHYRRSQIVLPQKAGKAPYTAAHICVEAVGPALFAGWADTGDMYRCADWGCRCGWRYAYTRGEPMGRPWPTPLIQITATSEEQTDNIYDALRPMIDAGPLSAVIPKTGEEFIRLPNRGRIDVVTSSARSRLGQRVTFVPQDETGVWFRQQGMIKVAETQRRGLSGMGGRSEETTNAWDPAEDSVAQRTAESHAEDIFRHHPEAPSSLVYRNKTERRKIHRHVYRGCRWIDLDAIEAEAAELLEFDPAQAERFFGNRIRAGEDSAFDPDRWDELADLTHRVRDGALICVGVDGARFDDAVAMIATEVGTGFQWPLGIWERPPTALDDYEHPADQIDGAMVDVFERFRVWRAYCDPQWIDHLVNRWKGRWGDKRVIEWYTTRPKPIAYALRNYRAAMTAGDLHHDGDPHFAAHIKNAKRRKVNVWDEDRRPMWSISKDAPNSNRKIDAAMAGALSWEAAGDCIAAGPQEQRSRIPVSL